jgi:hypothetical protein
MILKHRLFQMISIGLLLAICAYADGMPKKIYHQGIIKQDGQPFTGDAEFSFSLSGTDWSETHSAIDVIDGLYAIQLGSVNPLPYTIFSNKDSVMVEINVNGENLDPPIEILPVPIAFHAVTADRLKGDSLHINNNKVGIGTQTPEVMLDIDGPIRIGDDATSNAVPGTIRFTGSDFMGFNGNQWVSLTEKSIGSEGSAITVVSGEVISGGDSPVPVYMSKDGVIMAQTEAEAATAIYGTYYAAQTFRTDSGTHVIKGIWLNFAKKGTPDGNLDIFICDQNLNISTQLLKQSVPANDIQEGWNLFMFDSELSVNPETDYAIVVIASDCDSSNNIEWYYAKNDTLKSGQAFTIIQYYPDWKTHHTDFAFKLLSDNRVFTCHADDVSKLDFIGFAMTSAGEGQSIVVQTNGIVNGFDHLVIGEKYYIQDDGSIGLSPGTNGRYLGVATTKQQIILKNDMTWIQDKNGISYNKGNVGIGEKEAKAKMQITNIDTSQSSFVVQQHTGNKKDSFYMEIYGNESESAQGMIKSSDGNYVIVGQTNSYGVGGSDVFITKIDLEGKILWANTAGGSNVELAKSVIEDSDGGYIIVGWTNSYGHGNTDILLVKFDSSGNLVWGKAMGTTENDYGNDIIKTSDNGYAISGYTYVNGNPDAYVLKFNNGNSFQWYRIVGSTGSDIFSSSFDSEEYLTFIGSTSSYGKGSDDIFVVRFDYDGNLEWSRTIGWGDSEIAISVCKSSDNGFVIAGHTTLKGSGNKNILLSKFNNYCSLEWCCILEEISSGYVHSVKETLDKGYIVLGETNATNMFLLKYDRQGLLKWSKKLKGRASDILQLDDMCFLITGYDGGNILYIKTDPGGNIDEYDDSFNNLDISPQFYEPTVQSQSITPHSIPYPVQAPVTDYNPIINKISWKTSYKYPSNDSTPIKDVFVINNKGNVGIGTNDPKYKLHVLGYTYTAGIWASSDQRFKKNIKNLLNALNIVMQLKGVTYEWRIEDFPEMDFENGRHLGLIAQEVEKIMPELVHTDENGYKSIAYDKLTVLLIEAMKEQQVRLDNMERKMNQLIEHFQIEDIFTQ